MNTGIHIGVVVSHPIAELGEAGRALLRELLREHRRLHEVVLQLHDKHHRVSMEVRGPTKPLWSTLHLPVGIGWDVASGGGLRNPGGLTWPTSYDSLWVDLADFFM